MFILAFESHPEIGVVHGNAEYFGEKKGLWKIEDYDFKLMLCDNYIDACAIYRRKLWAEVGGYDENMPYQGLEDWEFWIGLLKNGEKIFKLETVGFYYRIKDSSRQADLNRNNKSHLFEYISIKHADFYVKQFGSFHELNQKILKKDSDFLIKIQSKKFLIDALLHRFFGFTFFGNKFKK